MPLPVTAHPGVRNVHSSTRPLLHRLAPAVLWAIVFLLFAINFAPLNDQYGRISPARQIARYGAQPFRDYFDPGYYLTEYSSAALQRLLGDNLVGEMLLDASFIATGVLLVFLLSRRMSRSTAVGLVAALFAVITLPRLYDYDKVLFYPLGVALCWRYLERHDAQSLFFLSAGIVVAGLYRYDNGLFIGMAALAAIVVESRRNWQTAARRCVQLVAVSVVLVLPAVLAVAMNGGVADAFNQMVTYARREGARTRISSPPAVTLLPMLARQPLAPRTVSVAVRWAPDVDDRTRNALEQRFGLHDSVRDPRPESRTWSYRLADSSPGNVRRLIADPRVEDTNGIDRSTRTVPSEPLFTRLRRAIPLFNLQPFPALSDSDNASAFLYYVFVLLPVAAALTALFVWGRSATSAADGAIVAALIVLCVLLDLFILRSPVSARIGGMAGPFAVLGTWIAVRLRAALRRNTNSGPMRFLRYAVAVVCVIALLFTADALEAATHWGGELYSRVASAPAIVTQVRLAAASPPPFDFLPTGALGPVVNYVHACTNDDDRVFATWFVPELYFFAQRGFAGRMVVAFGQHWSEPPNQRRIVDELEAESVPIVVSESEHHADFMDAYPIVAAYLNQRYRLAGRIHSGGFTYLLLVDRTRTPVRTDPSGSLPCFR